MRTIEFGRKLTAGIAGIGLVVAGLTMVPLSVLPANATGTTTPSSASKSAESTDSVPHMHPHPASDYAQAASALPAALVTAVQRDLGKTAAQYLADADAAADGVTVVDALADTGVSVLGSSMKDTTLVVNVPTATDAAAVAAVGAVAEIGAPAPFDTAGLTFTPAQDIYGGQGFYWQTSSSGFRCSVGFPGFALPNGARELATAGHCVVGMAGIQGTVSTVTQTAPGSTFSLGGAIGLPVAASGHFGDGYDSGLLAVTNSAATQKASALTWGGGAGAPLASAPLAITGESAAITGASLCKSGSTTGWTCGTIEAVDASLDVEGSTVNSIVATTCVLPGDSGGSALIGQTAVGITSSSSSSSSCSGNGYMSAFFPLVSSASKPSVASQFGTNWEPMVTVSTPVVTTANGGTTVAAGSLAGTLANATTQSAIQVFVDGGSTAVATASASSGSWSVALPVLTAGSHSYSVVATWGTYSTSAALNGTVSVSGDGAPTPPTPVLSLSPGNPIGSLDAATGSAGGTISAAGWALDPDTANPISVHIYLDGTMATQVTANGSRPDIAAAHSGYGADHGFTATLSSVAAGAHTVCAYALNVGTGSSNPSLGCKTINIPGGNPFGSLDGASGAVGGTVTASGWVIDPDTASPVTVRAYLDGSFSSQVTANTSRADVGAAYSGYGANHGFSLSVANVAPGSHSICLYAINIGTGNTNPSLGCKTVTIPGGNPFGSVDTVGAGVGVITASGWVIDPDTASPVTVRAYLDGSFSSQVTASASRADVGGAYPGYGANHAYSVALSTVTGGSHTLCLYAINIGTGNTNPSLGCTTVSLPGGNPFGSVDSVMGGTGSISVAGWAIDPDTTGPVAVHVYLDGTAVAITSAAGSRADIGNAYPAYGRNHGFAVTATGIAAGAHTVCVYAINSGSGDANPQLRCAAVTVR